MIQACVCLASTGRSAAANGTAAPAMISSSAGEPRIARSDAAAVQGALASAGSVVACCLPGDFAAAEYALAAGAAEVRPLGASPLDTCDIYWIGAGVIHELGDLFAAQLAENLRAVLVFDVLECTSQDRQAGQSGQAEQRTWYIVRDAGHGAREILTAEGPIVLVVAEGVARPPYVSRHRRQVARERLTAQRRQETARSNMAEMAQPMPGPWQPVRPRSKTAALAARPLGDADSRMNTAFSIETTAVSPSAPLTALDPETAARQLLRYLIHHAFVQRPASASESASPATAEPAQRDATAASQVAGIRRSSTTHAASLTTALQRAPRQPDESIARRLRRPRACPDRMRPEDARSDGAHALWPAGKSNRRPRRLGDPPAKRWPELVS